MAKTASTPAPTPAPVRPSPRVDAAALRALLDGPEHGVRDFVRQRLAEPAFAYPGPISHHEYRELVKHWLVELSKDGLGALAVPTSYGGKGDVRAFMAAFETLAYHDLSLTIKFGVQYGLFQGSVMLLGTEWHHRTFLPGIATGDLLGVFAMSELGSGSNVRDLETTATYDAASQTFEIHTPHDGAHKEWLGNAAVHGRMATVFAQLVTQGKGHGVHAFLVPIRDQAGHPMPGVTIGDTGLKEGLNGVDNGRIWFDRVRIPRKHLLDRFGSVAADGTYSSPIENPARRFFTMIGTLVGGRITIGLSALSAAKSALTIAIRYGNRRTQFGPEGGNTTALLDYRTHQRRLLPALATSIVLDLALSRLVDRFTTSSEGESSREIEGLAAGLKAYTAWFAQEAITQARECCGGQGYLAANRIAVLRGDIDVWTTFEGDNTVLYQLLAKALLTEYRQEFADMGVIRLLTRRARTALKAMNPVAARRDDEDHLRDPVQQLGLLRYREERLLDAAARRLRAGMKADPLRAMNDVQDHLMHLAQAHVERVAFEAVQDQVELGGPRLAPVLALLRDTFWASRVEADLGWFLMNGVVETPKAKAIRYLANKCCQELRPIAEEVTQAFGIPDAVLAAPIAFDPLPTRGAKGR